MSKKNKKIVNSLTGWGHGYVVSANTPNVIIGNVLTLVEILGLSEKQEQPFKDLIRQKIWDQFNNDGVGISGETHTKIRDAYYEEMNRARNLNQPPSLG